MASTVGGMRHIGVASGLTDQVCGEVRNLDEESQNRVLQFISEIKKSRPTQTLPENIGTAQALQNYTGRWSFNEGEREKLVQEVYRLREGVG